MPAVIISILKCIYYALIFLHYFLNSNLDGLIKRINYSNGTYAYGTTWKFWTSSFLYKIGNIVFYNISVFGGSIANGSSAEIFEFPSDFSPVGFENIKDTHELNGTVWTAGSDGKINVTNKTGGVLTYIHTHGFFMIQEN